MSTRRYRREWEQEPGFKDEQAPLCALQNISLWCHVTAICPQVDHVSWPPCLRVSYAMSAVLLSEWITPAKPKEYASYGMHTAQICARAGDLKIHTRREKHQRNMEVARTATSGNPTSSMTQSRPKVVNDAQEIKLAKPRSIAHIRVHVSPR